MPGFEVNALAAKEDQGSNVGLKKLDPASPDAAAMLLANFAFVRRHEVKIYPTQVQDRFGNKVIYTYDPAPGKARRLIKIEGFRPDNASDGRVIDIAYNDATGLITRVSAGARHWDYAYPNGALTTVTLPDQSTWRYSLGGLANAYIKAELSSPECWGPPMDPDQGTYSGSITHPSGATGTFSFKPTLHGRSNMPPDGQNCIWFSYWDGTDYQSTFVSVVPQLFAAVSIQDKQIAGPGLSGMQWHYDYSPAVNCSQGSCPGTKTVTVTSSGKRERHTFSNRFKDAEGMIEKLETGATGGGALSTQQHTYVTNASGQLFPDRVGISPFGRGDRSAERFAPVSMTQTTQDARVFTWQVAPGCDGATLCFDKFARPTSVIKSSAPAP